MHNALMVLSENTAASMFDNTVSSMSDMPNNAHECVLSVDIVTVTLKS